VRGILHTSPALRKYCTRRVKPSGLAPESTGHYRATGRYLSGRLPVSIYNRVAEVGVISFGTGIRANHVCFPAVCPYTVEMYGHFYNNIVYTRLLNARPQTVRPGPHRQSRCTRQTEY
jgi:hypothetical protein